MTDVREHASAQPSRTGGHDQPIRKFGFASVRARSGSIPASARRPHIRLRNRHRLRGAASRSRIASLLDDSASAITVVRSTQSNGAERTLQVDLVHAPGCYEYKVVMIREAGIEASGNSRPDVEIVMAAQLRRALAQRGGLSEGLRRSRRPRRLARVIASSPKRFATSSRTRSTGEGACGSSKRASWGFSSPKWEA